MQVKSNCVFFSFHLYKHSLTFSSVPLHTILRRDLSKIRPDDRRIGVGRQTVLVRGNAEVQLAMSLNQVVDARCSLASRKKRVRGREGSQENRE